MIDSKNYDFLKAWPFQEAMKIIDGLGDKIRSSSDITGLKEIKRDQLET